MKSEKTLCQMTEEEAEEATKSGAAKKCRNRWCFDCYGDTTQSV